MIPTAADGLHHRYVERGSGELLYSILSTVTRMLGNQSDSRVGVYLGTQHHARFRNTAWGVTTTNKYFQADQWRWVPFLVGVYLRQPGTQRHARIRNTGGVTTITKYLQADQ
ncbi:hypothetical protein EMCRGX_G030242 [Ephydatia muelleri]